MLLSWPSAFLHLPELPNPKPKTSKLLNPELQNPNLNPKPQTPNPKPQTLNPNFAPVLLPGGPVKKLTLHRGLGPGNWL